MRRVVVTALAAMAVYAAGAQQSVHDLIAAVQKGLRGGESDGRIAREIRKFQMRERLDERTIEELESAGAGPKTLEEMERLRYESAGLAKAPQAVEFPAPPTPSAAEQTAVLHAAARYALNYTDSLPDFLCEQTVRRYEQLLRQNGWDLKDTLTVKLSYLDREENYTLIAINGRKTLNTYDSIGGALSKGEFASLLLSLFDPSVGTHFWWDHWTTLRKRVTHVYRYRIEQEKSHYHLTAGVDNGFGQLETVIVGENGFVYIDRDSGRVVRIIDDAVIPWDFPVRQASRILDYDFTDIGGKPFLLPLRADVRMATDRIRTRNAVEFTGYRKFTGESTITYK
jgi:hypothetical protein